jgi:Hemocyanin, ig-like domain/Hemocyanin, copper containing domain
MPTLSDVRNQGEQLFTELLSAQEPGRRQRRARPTPSGAPRFSWFAADQAIDAGLLAVRLSSAAATRKGETAGLAAALAVVDEEKADADPELVRQGFALFVTHNDRGRRLVKPRVVQAAPSLFLAPAVKRIGNRLSIGGLSPTLDYWREDMLANEHHQHWHEVYPWIGRPPENFTQWVSEVSTADKVRLLNVITPGVNWSAQLANATPAQVAGFFANGLNAQGRRRVIDAALADPPTLTRAVFRKLFRLNDRHGELFLYMHRQMLARYDAELLSHDLQPVKPFTATQWPNPIPEGYDPEGLQNQQGAPFTTRRQNKRFPASFVNALKALAQEVDNALSTKKIPGADASVPTRPIAASPLGEFVEEGLHNNGHGFLGALSEPIPAGQLGQGTPNGVMNNPLAAIRDQVFWRWHKLIDDLGDKWQSTQAPENFSDAPKALIRDGLAAGAAPWTSPDIILVRTSDLPNQSAAQLQQLGERLFGGANWDKDFTAAPAQSGNVSLTTINEFVTVISTATLANGRIVKFLNHEPFTYFIRVENTSNQQISVTARIFLVPTKFEKDRRAWIEMDKFTATLAAGQKAVLHRPDTESAVIKRKAETSPTAIANRPGGRTSYCDCGWPYTLLLPRGTAAPGVPCRLLVMFTDATKDKIGQPGECGSMSFCGARDRYPDDREMGYPFARPFGPGANALRDTLLGLPNAAGRSVNIRHAGP